jgi:hypothetical protein
LVLLARIEVGYSPLEVLPGRHGGCFELRPMFGHEPERIHQRLERRPVRLGIACLEVLQTTHTDAGSFRKLSLGQSGCTSGPAEDGAKRLGLGSVDTR